MALDATSLNEWRISASGNRGRIVRLATVLVGIGLGQALLYGPSLLGRKILLPLDILAVPAAYLPSTPEFASIQPQNHFLSDMICLDEPARRFAASEVRAGRLPMWVPYRFGGAPFIWPKFSPFYALRCVTASPIVIAWSELLFAMTAGLGAYLFFRGVLAVGFWPATICAWCYPLTGFFVFNQGYPVSLSICWLPWILVAVDTTVRRANPFAPLALSVLTCLVLTGQLDIAGEVLLLSGLFALWRLFDAYGRECIRRAGRKAALGLLMGWTLGFLLAAPYILPVLEYSATGARMAKRISGGEERPPIGLAALPQAVLPDFYGSNHIGSVRFLANDNQAETSAGAYASVIATLFVAPLGWCSRRHRSINLFWVLVAFLSLSWTLNVPGIVTILRLPGLNMLSYNRLVFVTGFAILALTAVGLDSLSQGTISWRRWFWVPCAVLGALCAWCVFRTFILPEPWDSQLGIAVAHGQKFEWIHDAEGVRRAQTWFSQYFATSAVWCGLGLGGWYSIAARLRWHRRMLPAAAVLMLGELSWFAHGRRVQCDPALYYPPIPVLRQIANAAPGRIIGMAALPPNLAAMCGLRDIRGYDAVDPQRPVDLILAATDPVPPTAPYALTQWSSPVWKLTSAGELRLSPIMDLLDVRYVIGRGEAPAGSYPAFQGPDYFALVNPLAVGRVFVPRSVQVVTNDAERLQKLASPEFNPRKLAYVETPLDLPSQIAGEAKVLDEIPTRVTVSFNMVTAGLVVLTDHWDKGWRATVNGKTVPILRTDHAIRGVVAPPGSGTIVFRYEPGSFTLGLQLAGSAIFILIVWLLFLVWKRRPQKLRSPGCGRGVDDSLG